MPVLSYIAYPANGEKQQLLNDLTALKYCEPVAADNQDILILVTDTPNDDEEKSLQQKLKKIKSLQSLSMTFGHMDE